MRAIDAATAHYKAVKTDSILVPEWKLDGKPLRIYWRPLNLAERAKLYNGGVLDIEAYATILILKALDEKGKPLFSHDDLHFLTCDVDSSIVTRVALKIIVGPKAEEIEKN